MLVCKFVCMLVYAGVGAGSFAGACSPLSIYLSIYIYILWLCVEWGRALHFLGMVLKIEFVGETAV